VVGTATIVVGTGVATVVAGVVTGWFEVHPAVIMTTAITRTSKIEDVFIQLIKISPAHTWAGKLFMRYGLAREIISPMVNPMNLYLYLLLRFRLNAPI
jgi:hypothetical protein